MVVVVVGVVLIIVVVMLLLLWYRQQTDTVNNHLVISPEDIQIINPPVCRWDGTWESGKAKYRNALVAVEPLWDLRLAGVASLQQQFSQVDG